jgi:hypothetical protein
MNAKRLLVVLSLSSVFAAATAQDHDYTREQVRSELEAAQQSGDIVTSFAARTERELFPGRYLGTAPAAGMSDSAAQVLGKTREQVVAELVAAKQSGDIVTSFAGRTERELFPARYPSQNGASNRSYADQ